MWISTFHSACVRILRREADRIGYEPGFSIYDDGDTRRLVEHVLDDLGIDQKRFPPRSVLGAISQAKSELLDADGLRGAGVHHLRRNASPRSSPSTSAASSRRTAMDFDDLLSDASACSGRDAEVLEHYQERFVHLLVDEYQDTNRAQNEIVTLIGARHRNVCVVGDSDQSIYRFRGAEIRNLLDFERAFPDATTIVLDQNYRSTQTILDAANAVIGNNVMRQEKKLWSRARRGRDDPPLPRRRRARRGDLRRQRDRRRLRREEDVRSRRDRRLLPDERAEPRDRAGARRPRRSVPGDRRHTLLRPP